MPPSPARILLASLLLWAAPSSGAPLDRGEVGDYARRVLRELDVPGMALAVVKDGQVVLAEGYGVRRVGAPEPVDANTLFGIASNSKAFTCTALSILIEEGRLGWDDPVTRHLPEFQMNDPWVTREITVRDLVTHRAGLGRGAGDLMWWPPTDFSRDEILHAVRHLEPASSFRSRYAYNNVLYIAAGEVVARVSGRPWREFVRERILQPLGMERTTTSAAGLRPGDNVASPHVLVGGRATPLPIMSFENAGGAVGIHSSAADMARWMRMLLGCSRSEERPEGQVCALRPASIRRMWTAQVPRATPEMPPGLEALRSSFVAYALGFGVQESRGKKIVTHTGGLPGLVSRVTLVPGERLGIAALTNQETASAFDAVTQHILDAELGPPDPPVDWLEAFTAAAAARQRRAEAKVAKDAAERVAGSRPSLPLAGYAAAYRDPWYGVAIVAEQDGHLVLSMTRTPGMVADLEHWQHDVFVARWRETYMSDVSPCDAYVTFALDPAGSTARMTMTPVSPAIDFSFDFQDLAFTPIPAEGARERAPD